jgi:hypothetical protein
MKELVVVTNDRVGLLADISGVLAKHNINIEGIDVEVVGKKAVCRVLTVKEEASKAKAELEKADFKVLASDVLVLKLPDRPGELSGVARKLADSGVSIKNVHLLGKNEGHALCALEADKPKVARELLASYIE